MVYRKIEETLAQATSPETIQSYLRSIDWVKKPSTDARVVLYADPHGGLGQAIIPLDDDTPDYARRVIDAAIAVAEATGRDIQYVLGKFLGIALAPAPRNLVLCFDGAELSWGTTNVRRFWRALEHDSHQVRYYSGGEQFGGAYAAHHWGRALALQRAMILRQLAVEKDLANAYRFLNLHYQAGDRIFLIAFGSGGYTARALAGLVHVVGLLEKGSEEAIGLILRCYLDFYVSSGRLPFKDLEVLRNDFGKPVRIEFLGIWDSVRPNTPFGGINPLPYGALNPSVTKIRHAIALDERRSVFWPDLFKAADGGQELKQVWFPGVHSDVGGGYPEAEAGLAKVAFEWMLNEAATAGLRFNGARTASILGMDGKFSRPDPLGPMHDSLQGVWRILEWLPRRRYQWATRKQVWFVPRGRPRQIPEGSLIHASVLERMRTSSSYQPKLPETVKFVRNDAVQSG